MLVVYVKERKLPNPVINMHTYCLQSVINIVHANVKREPCDNCLTSKPSESPADIKQTREECEMFVMLSMSPSSVHKSYDISNLLKTFVLVRT